MAPVKLRTETIIARRTCAGCDMFQPPVRQGAPLCRHCAADIPAALARIATRRGAADAIYDASAARLDAAFAALTPDERRRWDAYLAARDAVHAATADEVTARRVHLMTDALKSGDTDETRQVRAWLEAAPDLTPTDVATRLGIRLDIARTLFRIASVTPGLRAIYVADEGHFWVIHEAMFLHRRCDEQVALIAAWEPTS